METFKFKKKFGQNFIKDSSITKRIASSAGITKDDLVIEIGPGAGSLTKELATISKYVLCYEIDSELKDILENNLGEYQNVSIIYSDFLERNIKEDIAKYQFNNLYLIANIPYYITTPIITKIIEDNLDITKMVLMVQKEVGDRFSSSPGNKEYSSITVLLNYYYDIKKLFVVKRDKFTPSPNVDSAVISLSKKDRINKANDIKLFNELIKNSFQFKRKNIKNNLKKYDLNIIEKVLLKYNKTLLCRAEELDVDIFIDIANNLKNNS